ncbi:uncharacterized protein with FMN-binding domain [Motilibacter rhizosphaerae]|uniref:Uncharacterized protein with FMN-binding domain n=1 Tax=Motilibacter rhizosphaerae TaxID=598652 RepID=A0A4Q7NV83_9ACTN|nr:FMN-binding protein [Motilibacter rhizosphaerae]RZS90860.1 uncharacterized protein with FMN-binding domain [Motilibacter rhizosphaerae]
MRRITAWAVSTVAALVLLFSYRTSTAGVIGGGSSAVAAASPGTDTTSSSQTGSDTGTVAPQPSTSTSTSSSSASASTTTTTTSYTGSSVDTRWGPVQVRITVKAGRITAVEAVVYPSENPRDQEINSYALPVLQQEALKAQSAKIDAVGGATVTSDGYISTLQSAIDAAHLG